MNKSPLMNETEAAGILNLAPKTLSRWRWAGKGPKYVKLGSAVRYSEAALSNFIEAGST